LSSAGRDLAYVLVMLCFSVLDFVVWVTGVTVTGSLLVFIVGLPVWLATAYGFAYAAGLDRRVAGWYLSTPILGVYRKAPGRGFLARLRVVTTDPQTWRDLGWLIVNSTLGFLFATVTLTVTALAIGYLLMPLWWWAISDPSEQYATLNLGIYTVTSTGWAFVTTGIGLALLPIAMLINHAAATAHASLAARMLGPRDSSPAPRSDSYQVLAPERPWSPVRES
jgi:Putative sensor